MNDIHELEQILLEPNTQYNKSSYKRVAKRLDLTVSEIFDLIFSRMEKEDCPSFIDDRQSLVPADGQISKEEVGISSKVSATDMKVRYKVVGCQAIQTIAKNAGFPFVSINDQPHVWTGSHFESVLDDKILNNFIRKCGSKYGIPPLIIGDVDFQKKMNEQFVATLPISTKTPSEKILVNLENGTLHIESEKKILRNSSPFDELAYVLPFKYNPKATATLWQAYLDKVLPGKSEQDLLAEHFAYALVPNGKLKLEKVLVLYGDGANGKSVCHDVISALFGRKNVSHYSLENLCSSNGYYRSMIEGKMLNYCSEIGTKLRSDFFKKLASGEPIEVRNAHQKPRVIYDYAKLIFNTNDLPQSSTLNKAYFRRLHILHFGVSIPESEQDVQLASKIIENELPGIFNWILAGIYRLLRNKRFTFCQSSEDHIAEYSKNTDSVVSFIDETGYAKDNTSRVAVEALYKQYSGYCRFNRYVTYPKNIFSKKLKAMGFECQRNSRCNYFFISETNSN